MNTLKKINFIDEHPSHYEINTKHDKHFAIYTEKYKIELFVY